MKAMWVYEQKTGRMLRHGVLVAVGYSGAPGFINDPESEGIAAHGPIPRGLYRMTAVVHESKTVGPLAIALAPVGHDARGRCAFMVHGDSVAAPGTASRGCIIMPRHVRIDMSRGSGLPGERGLLEVV